MNDLIVINPDNTIIESNKLIREMFDYTVTKRQFDLIYAIISLVKPTDTEFTEYVVPYKTFGMIFNPANPDCSITYNDIEKAVNGIMKSCFRIVSDEKKYFYHWVETAVLDEKEHLVTFKLNKDVQKFYLKLKTGEYSAYLLKDLISLSTIFQANMFRYLVANAGFNNAITISIENAKKFFYGKDIITSEFIKKVDSSLVKINEKTNINASYEKVKEGNTIVALQFSIENKYIKQKKERTELQIESDKEKGKAMWQENLEMKQKIAELEAQLRLKEA